MTTHRIPSVDGAQLHIHEAGNPAGPTIVLIHGWSQHHLSWSKQFAGKLAEEFRLIAPDLRGHGASDKPLNVGAYSHSQPWADDIAAIIDALALENPLLIGWSMGGWIVMDYLRVYGDAAIAGIGLVGSSVVTASDPQVMATRSPAVRADGMYSQDHATALNSTIGFLKACVAAPLSKQDLAFMTGFNMLVPPMVRKAARLRQDADYRAEAAALTKPAALFWGEAERVCTRPMLDATQAAMPEAQLFTYAGSGHAPFWERPEAFDADLANFARSVMVVAG